MNDVSEKTLNVGLFVTCLVDLFRPSIGFSCVKLLEMHGCKVFVPEQTCCGQPAYNSGDRKGTQAIAKGVISAFQDFDYVVVPSGSCAAMLIKHYPDLFKNDPDIHPKANALAAKTYEIVTFLHDVLKITAEFPAYNKKVTYHDSCSGLRELKIHQQPRDLLQNIPDLEFVPLKDNDVCCGFGGTFCVKYPDISTAIVSDKTENIIASNADVLVAGDLGCLMNMAGRLSRQGHNIEVRHIVEILAGMTDQPGIAGSEKAQ